MQREKKNEKVLGNAGREGRGKGNARPPLMFRKYQAVVAATYIRSEKKRGTQQDINATCRERKAVSKSVRSGGEYRRTVKVNSLVRKQLLVAIISYIC